MTSAPTARLPRRAFLAAGLSAITAAAAVALVTWGALDAPQTETFTFSRGVNLVSGEDMRLRAHLIQAVADDRLRVIITGHTGSAGDPAANLELSEDRARLVADIARELGIADSHITSAGLGGGAPLPRQTSQSDRAYQGTLARVDVTFHVLR